MYTMSIQKGTKINHLLKIWPVGAVAVSPWLEKQGVDRQLIQRYKTSDWVKSIGSGAFVRSGDKVDWRGGVYALQSQLKRLIHPGGKTALQMLGLAHYVPLGGREKVKLFQETRERCPRWFLKHDWGVDVEVQRTSLFFPDNGVGLSKMKANLFNIAVSSAERAMFELLELLPQEQTFDEAQKLMEGLGALRPSLVQSLLERCTSVKTKRLFMYLAQSARHAWVGRLNLLRVNFGDGKRTIVRGGRLDPVYKITVPRANG